jgi:hypothetical protein
LLPFLQFLSVFPIISLLILNEYRMKVRPFISLLFASIKFWDRSSIPFNILLGHTLFVRGVDLYCYIRVQVTSRDSDAICWNRGDKWDLPISLSEE